MYSLLGGRALAAILLSLFVAVSWAAPPLLISPQIKLEVPLPDQIAHQAGRLIFAYKNGRFSHEELGPEGFYPGIDLTGMERAFVIALFDEKHRSILPKWLAVLAEEQAESLGIAGGTTTEVRKGALELRTVYLPDQKEGEIFILSQNQIHRLSFRGDKDDFSALIAGIKER